MTQVDKPGLWARGWFRKIAGAGLAFVAGLGLGWGGGSDTHAEHGCGAAPSVSQGADRG